MIAMSCPVSASLAESDCSSLLQTNYPSPQEANSLLTLSSQAAFHGEFYFQDDMEKFLVEDKLFRIHVQFLTRESENLTFISSRQRDPVHQAIFLPGVTIPEFEGLLKYFYYGMREDYNPALDESIALLSISCREEFGMKRIRTCAIQSIDRVGGIADPVQRIVLGAKHGVQEWIDSAHSALHQRKEPITLSEARLLGLEMYLSIVDAREERLQKLLNEGNRIIQEPPLPTSSDLITDVPSPFAGLKGKALKDAKKKAKNNEKLKVGKEIDKALSDVPVPNILESLPTPSEHKFDQSSLPQTVVELYLSGFNRELERGTQTMEGIDSKIAPKQMELSSNVKIGSVLPQSHYGNYSFEPSILPTNEEKEDTQLIKCSSPSTNKSPTSDLTEKLINPNPFAGLKGKALKDAKKREMLERIRQQEILEKETRRENADHQTHEEGKMVGCACNICLRDRHNV